MPGPSARAKVAQRVAALRAQVQALEARQLQLLVRAAPLSLLNRLLREVVEHFLKHGDSEGAEVVRRRMATLKVDGGGGGDASDAPGFEARLEHLRPGASLLRLESVSAARVSEVKAMTGPELATALSAIVVRIQSTAAAAGAPDAAFGAAPFAGPAAAPFEATPKAAPAPAAASGNSAGTPWPAALSTSCALPLDAAGQELFELYNLALIWNFPAFTFIREHRWDNLQSTTDPSHDAPLIHWDHVVRRMRMSMEQLLMSTANARLLANRLAALQLELREILKEIDTEARKGPTGLAATLWQASSGVGRVAGAVGAEAVVYTEEELLHCMEHNSQAERWARWEANLIGNSLYTPVQVVEVLCATYPFPFYGPSLVKSSLYLLRTRPEEFPWVGPPMHLGPVEAWQLAPRSTQQTPL